MPAVTNSSSILQEAGSIGPEAMRHNLGLKIKFSFLPSFEAEANRMGVTDVQCACVTLAEYQT